MPARASQFVAAAWIVVSALVAGPAVAAERPSVETLFTRERDVLIGPKIDRFDYQSFDASTGRLFIAEMSVGKLLVFDTNNNTIAAELDGFPKITGVLAVPELRKVYVSVPGSGIRPSLSVALGMVGIGKGDGQVAILDSRSLRELARLPAGVFPDGLAYDPDHRKIFVTDEFGKSLTVIDGVTDQTVARIDVGGQVGNVQYDEATKRVYAPVQSTDELVAVDPASYQVVARYKLTGGKHPHGLAIAPGAAVGFVACDEDDRLLAVALDTGRIQSRLSIAHDPDVLALDAASHRLYVAGESGELSILDIENAAAPKLIATLAAGDGAHTVAVDPQTHRVFLPLRDVGGNAVLRILRPRA
jgi:DNA-binding beta-propeller fold protein YncE